MLERASGYSTHRYETCRGHCRGLERLWHVRSSVDWVLVLYRVKGVGRKPVLQALAKQI